MFFRRSGIAVLVALVLSLLPGVGRAQGNVAKDDVLALSRWIDDYLARRWKEQNVTPGPLAEDAIYFRRLSLDLTGKIPELTQVWDFLQENDSGKRWRWVEQYLASEASSRHFANIWRTHIIGRSSNPQFQFLYPQFEAFLKERFEKNTPLDELVRQILTAQNNVAGMQPGGFAMQRGGASPIAFFAVNEFKAENVAGNASRAFLGVKIECAQCHSHPFASWTKEQFWEFAAFFDGLRPNQARLIALNGRVAPAAANPNAGRQIKIPNTDKVVKAKFLSGEEPRWEEKSDARLVLANWMTSRSNPYFARAMADQVWAYFFGVSLLEPILEPSDDSPVTHEELLDRLARELADHHFDMRYLIRAIVHTQAYQRGSGGPDVASKDDYHLFLRMPVRSLTPEQLFDSLAEATAYRQTQGVYDPRTAFNPSLGGPRAEFLNKFGTQERRYDPQTSILQALFMMNGKFMTERTSGAKNESLHTLITQKRGATEPEITERVIRSMYYMILCRPPRPEVMSRVHRYIVSGGPTNSRARAIEDVYWALLNSPEFLLNH
jgi:hypothetical protein